MYAILLFLSISLLMAMPKYLYATENKMNSFSDIFDDKFHQWELEKESNGIKIFSQSNPDSEYKSYMGIMVVKTSLNSLVNLIEDSDACSEWNHRCIKEEVLKIVSPTEKYKRIEFSTPLIFPNRDSIIHTVRTQDPVTKTVTITFTGKPDYLPKQPSFIRIPKVTGSWTLRPLNQDEVELIYQTYSEPGGMVPPIFANQGNQNWVLNTLINMIDMLSKNKYKNADGIVEELILKK